MGYPYVVGEHDIEPGVTVCFVKDIRTDEIVSDCLHIDAAEATAERMNEEEYAAEREYEFDDDE